MWTNLKPKKIEKIMLKFLVLTKTQFQDYQDISGFSKHFRIPEKIKSCGMPDLV